jgi:hypothetical protein
VYFTEDLNMKKTVKARTIIASSTTQVSIGFMPEKLLQSGKWNPGQEPNHVMVVFEKKPKSNKRKIGSYIPSSFLSREPSNYNWHLLTYILLTLKNQFCLAFAHIYPSYTKKLPYPF